MDAKGQKIKRMAIGQTPLADAKAEQAAQLSASGTPDTDLPALVGVTADEITTIKEDAAWRLRHKYLVRYFDDRRDPNFGVPKSNNDYLTFALKQLHLLARKSKQDKDKVSACKVLALVVDQLRKAPVTVPAAKADTTIIDALKGDFEE